MENWVSVFFFFFSSGLVWWGAVRLFAAANAVVSNHSANR